MPATPHPVPRRRDGSATRPSPATIAAVARRAGVSIATVSRVVNGVANKASSTTIARVQAAVAALGYRPAGPGQALRQRHSRMVGVLANNLGNTSMAAVAAALEVALRDAGFAMVLCDTHDRPELQDEYLAEMRAHFARATVLLGAVASPRLDEYRGAGEPLLFVNRRDPGAPASPFVGIDNRRAGADAADFFRDRDVAAPVILHASLASSATADRVAGFEARFAGPGRRRTALRRITWDDAEHLDIGYRAVDLLLRAGTPPGGLLCLSDLIAYGAGRRLREAGIAVPRSCLVVGFDDNPLNDWVAPWLTSVRIPYDEYGTAVLAALQTLWRGESVPPVILPHRLVVRAAAGTPRPRARR